MAEEIDFLDTIVTRDKVAEALQYRAETDVDYAKAKSLVRGLETAGKIVLAQAFLRADGTVAERDAKARASKEYIEWKEKYDAAITDYETMSAIRITGELNIDVWRTLEKSRREGNIQ